MLACSARQLLFYVRAVAVNEVGNGRSGRLLADRADLVVQQRVDERGFSGVEVADDRYGQQTYAVTVLALLHEVIDKRFLECSQPGLEVLMIVEIGIRKLVSDGSKVEQTLQRAVRVAVMGIGHHAVSVDSRAD